MKYPVKINCINQQTYIAYCPLFPDFQVMGGSFNEALTLFQNGLARLLQNNDITLEVHFNEKEVNYTAAEYSEPAYNTYNKIQ